jgi:hypothetical protein
LLGTCKSGGFQYITPGSKQPARDGQMLTCAIHRSGIRGLDLFLATSSGYAFLELGRRQVGSVVSALGDGSAGVDSPGADGSRAGVAVAGSVGVDFLGADGSGAGVVVAGFDLGGAALADLTKPIQLYHHTSRTKQNIHYATRCKLTVSTSS